MPVIIANATWQTHNSVTIAILLLTAQHYFSRQGVSTTVFKNDNEIVEIHFNIHCHIKINVVMYFNKFACVWTVVQKVTEVLISFLKILITRHSWIWIQFFQWKRFNIHTGMNTVFIICRVCYILHLFAWTKYIKFCSCFRNANLFSCLNMPITACIYCYNKTFLL